MDKKNQAIVIARFNEDITWANKYSQDYDIVVYNKGDSNLELDYKHYLEQLPNIGREAHSYIYHIINNYDNLHDEIIFTQGSPGKGQDNFFFLPLFEKGFDSYFSGPDGITHEYGHKYSDGYIGYGEYVYGDTYGAHTFEVLVNLSKLIFKNTSNLFPNHNVTGWTSGSIFRVKKEYIQMRNITFWHDLMEFLENNYETPWALERVWHNVFDRNEII